MEDDRAEDRQTGISIRFIRQYDPEQDSLARQQLLPHDVALSLAMGDGRDLPFAEKLADALEFIAYKKRQLH